MTMTITEEIFEAFLKCRTKSYLYSNRVVGTRSEFGVWEQQVQEDFKESCQRQLRCTLSGDEWFQGTPSSQSIEQQRYRFIFDCRAATTRISARLHGLEVSSSRSDNAGHHPYNLIRFLPNEKLEASHKLVLGFDALAVSHASGKMPRLGKIVHGRQHTSVTIPLTSQVEKVRAVLERIDSQGASASSPPVILNSHCSICEYQARCRQIAAEKDDLSLLPRMTDKERRKHHEKGIFTVTQLSYTFRPPRRSTPEGNKHYHALKALAIRKNKIHILGSPKFETHGTPVYFDVEGIPDRDFYYLIGLRIGCSGQAVHHSFWANDETEEQRIWADCLRQLSTIDNPQLIHYGSYEAQFLKRMRTRYPHIGEAEFVERLTKSAFNLVAVIYAHIYFPTYSNGLKDVAGFLDFRWSVSPTTGLASVAWRCLWERSRQADLKQKLITYNAEDCEGTQRVAETLKALCQGMSSDVDVVNVNSLKREYPRRFGEVQFLLPEFEQINQAAYWDYQRNKVYVRSSPRLQRLSRETLKEKCIARVRPNKIIRVEEPRRVPRCKCKDPLIYKWGTFGQTVYDLRYSSTGIQRCVIRYLFHRYICWHCKATHHQYVRKPRFGVGLCSYLLYQIIEVQVPQNAVAKSVRQLFGLPLSRALINKVKASQAVRYQGTYQTILDRISAGSLVHADETKVGINGQDGYVWVFTNLEEVAFVYSESREARTAQMVLRNFRGVLVSDFYAGYEAINCAQQKCLIHLIRDMNDDLCKQPFNEEIADLARQFAALIRPIIESVDRYGLKARYLQKHKGSVDRFYEVLSKRGYQTEVAVGYRKRFEKNRDRLFTFLDHDGVPWNNNAEHAIKAFARLRNSIGGTSSAKGMKDYLVLLSICETCKYKGVSFLDFLRSEEADINDFADSC